MLLPPSLDDWVGPDHPVRFVQELVESLDLSALGITETPGEEGRPHYAPEMLLAVWIYGYMERIRSSRALERACMRDVAFLWLTGNLHPDHNTLWRFFRAHRGAMSGVFKRVVRVATHAGLVGFALHAVDGKIAAASSMQTAQHRKALLEALKRLDATVERDVADIEAAEQQEESGYAMPAELRDPRTRRAKIQAALAELEQAGTGHLHRAEPEARVMRGRAHKVLGYNAQVVVDHDSDLIVATDVSGEESDYAQLVPMLAKTLETTGRVAEESVADAGYASGEQFDEAERRHLPVLVATPPQPDGEFDKSRFRYDQARDVYICPRGETLGFQRVQPPEQSGKSYVRRVYRCKNKQCPVRDQCTKDKSGRAIMRSAYDEPFARQLERNKTPKAKNFLALRKEVVEHIFALAKWRDRFDRFTVRGLQAAQAQWALVCTAINLHKLLVWWRNGRLRWLAAA